MWLFKQSETRRETSGCGQGELEEMTSDLGLKKVGAGSSRVEESLPGRVACVKV